MQHAEVLTADEIIDLLLHVSPNHGVHIWGPPGIGKTAIVNAFADQIGMECVTMLGSQLAPEDLIGVPKIDGNMTKFFPPSMIVRDKPIVLFLDELNGASEEVQRSMYSLILSQQVGELRLVPGSIVIAAGNRQEDNAIVRQMSSALVGRMLHVTMKADARSWLNWYDSKGYPSVVSDYIRLRPDHLWSKPQPHEESYSSPRSWHYFAIDLASYPEEFLKTENGLRIVKILARGWLKPEHADSFVAFYRNSLRKFDLESILKGTKSWPSEPTERDSLLFLVETFRSKLIKELPVDRSALGGEAKTLALKTKDLLKSLSRINNEFAQIVVIPDQNGNSIPDWLMVEIARDLPRLASKG